MTDVENRLTSLEKKILTIENYLNFKEDEPTLFINQETSSNKTLEFEVSNATPSKIVSWLKSNWIALVGIFLIILASSWFIGYAVMNNWIDVKTRLLICLSFGFGLYGQGMWMLKRNTIRGQILVLLGMALSLVSLYLGHQFHQIFDTLFSFAFMLFLTATAVFIAVKKELSNMATFSIFFMMLVPLFIQSNYGSMLLQLNYLLMINVLTLLIFLFKGWAWPFQLAWIWTVICSYNFPSSKTTVTALYLSVFYLLFSIPAAFSAIKKTRYQTLLWKGGFLLLTTSLVLLYWIELHFPWHLQGFSNMTAAVLLFYFGYRMSKDWEIIHVEGERIHKFLAGIFTFSVMSFASMAIVDFNPLGNFLELDVMTIRMICFLIQGVLAIAIAYYILKAPSLTKNLSFFLFPLFFEYFLFHSYAVKSLFSLSFVYLCVAAMSFLMSTWIVYKASSTPKLKFDKAIIIALSAISGIFFMQIIWNVSNQLVSSENIARGIALVSYAFVGVVLFCQGKIREVNEIRIGGVIVLLLVLVRLLTVEVWLMPVIIRIITFVLAGGLFVLTAFVDKRLKPNN